MSRTERHTLAWNFVARNFRPHEQLRKKIREKISKLERHLQHFPADAVHLHIALEWHARKPLFTAALTLRVPSNILHCEKKAADPIPALDRAVKALLRELSDLKSELRREHLWKRQARRKELHEAKATRFAEQSQPAGRGPQTLADSVSALLQEHHGRLVAYVRREIWRDETAGDVSVRAIDPRAVVDEVARQVLAAPERRPRDASYPVWFYTLVREELRARVATLHEQRRALVPLEARRTLADDAERAEGYDPEQPLHIIEEQLEPPVVETKDLLPDPHTLPPDEEVARHDLVDYLQKISSGWSKVERDVFALHFLEGFEADEIAMVEGLKKAETARIIEELQTRLRQITASAAACEGSPQERLPTRLSKRTPGRAALAPPDAKSPSGICAGSRE
jgi:ribosomal subunit interface protein